MKVKFVPLWINQVWISIKEEVNIYSAIFWKTVYTSIQIQCYDIGAGQDLLC